MRAGPPPPLLALLLVVFGAPASAAPKAAAAVPGSGDLSLVERFDDGVVGVPPEVDRSNRGKHVCVVTKNSSYPSQTKQVYCKPTLKTVREKCFFNQICTSVRIVYERAYRDVVTTKHTKHLAFECCPGWTKASNTSKDCDIPVCDATCANGGTCVKPNKCHCDVGFTGKTCEEDVDECAEKPCDQTCHNTRGSYKCECRENFTLKADGQSCVKDVKDDTEIEGSDPEIDSYHNRLSRLEEEVKKMDVSEIKKLQNNYKNLQLQVKNVEVKLDQIKQYKHDMHKFRSMMTRLWKRTEKIEGQLKKYRM